MTASAPPTPPAPSSERARQVLRGDVRAGARLMRDLDDRVPSALVELRELYPHTGRAYVLGLTGNPGVGKSTVVDALIGAYRKEGKRVGVVAVDPTSPFTGGAILGDRIRMQQHALDAGVFIRSLATRGQLGGMSRSTFDVALVLDAMGYDLVLIETVGVGQDEIDVMRAAHTTVVITVPGLGDDIQAIKAGILETADVLVVNKADREGADRAVRDLMHMLELRDADGGRRDVEIVKTIAAWGLRDGSGMDDLLQAIAGHRERMASGPEGERRAEARAAAYVAELVKGLLADRAALGMEKAGGLAEVARAVAIRALDPYTAADEIVRVLDK
ncbi:MAG TPA: methylmalonyl Co-A mutase-associated GTPase MeaB [Kofleriaceae bacterium]|nr:methylmalonyl Co-A mutase-associated GTPase MeaB [Kofleriaceae bacterium]